MVLSTTSFSSACAIATRTRPAKVPSSWTSSPFGNRSLARGLRVGSLANIRAAHSSRQRVDPFPIHQSAASVASGAAGRGRDGKLSLTSDVKFGYKLLAARVHPPPSRRGSVDRLEFQSGIQYSAIIYIALCVVAAVAVTYCGAPARDDSSREKIHDEPNLLENMAKEVPSGHHGNLTPEQENKLRKLWHAIFRVCGVHGGIVAAAAADGPPADDMPAAKTEGTKKKRGFGFFKSTQSDAPSSSQGTQTPDPVDDDRYGLSKQYQEALESQKPEDIRETLWAMMKHDHPDALVLRFLRARKWDVDKALVMLVSAMNWRHSKMKVEQDIMKNGEGGAAADEKGGDPTAKKLGGDFLKQIRQGKSFLHGTDREGRPICLVKARLHRADDQSPESLERYTVYLIETARFLIKPPVDTANIFFDMTGFTLANMDYHSVKFMIQCFEANYPESLGVVLVHNAPWVFQGIWRIIRGWLDPVVAAKVNFTNSRADLEKFIPPGQIIKDLGGDEDWEFKYREPVQGENDVMNDTTTRDRLLEERQALYAQFEDCTRRWINHPDGAEAQEMKAERDSIASKLREGYWRLDPFIRARSLYDREGIILPDGDIDWYHHGNADTGETGTEKNGSPNDTSVAA